MRNTIRLILLFIFIGMAAMGQSPNNWKPSPYFFQYKGLKSDSLLVLPKILSEPGLIEDGALRFDSTTGFLQLRKSGVWGDISPYLLTGLSTFPDSTIQPWDNMLRGFEKTQGQFNAIIGRYIENQDTGYQSARFKLAGINTFTSTVTNSYPINVRRYNYATGNGLVAYRNPDGGLLGYTGLASGYDSLSLFITSNRARLHLINRDTTSIVFSSIDAGGTINSHTFYRAGHWRMLRDAVEYRTFDNTLYSPTYTLSVQGYTFTDSITNALALLNGRSMRYTRTTGLLSCEGLNTNDSYQIQLKKSGGIDYPALYIIGNGGFTGINTNAPTSQLQVAGSFALPVNTISSNTTLDGTYHTVIATAALTITIPTASSSAGRIYRLVNYNTGGNVTISSVLRDGSATTSLPNNAKWTIQSNGTNWYVIQD